jgi:phage shock protein A
MIKQQADQKKAIQDQIRQAEQSLNDLRKQLASVGK